MTAIGTIIYMNIKAPRYVVDLLVEIVNGFKELLQIELVGIYLHGSLAMGSFNPKSSDVDILVVTMHKVSLAKKEQMASLMLKLSQKAPPKGIELSVVTQEAVEHFQHPTPFEFHFSSAWLERFKNHQVDLIADRTDGDLAAHFTIVKARGLTLYGEPINDLFLGIPEKYYRDSIIEDAKGILGDMSSNPVYSVLNLCRVRAFIEDGIITSKQEGGEWAIARTQGEDQKIIEQALAEYKDENRTEWDSDALMRFGQRMSAFIFQ